jgi:hypothetical protein
MEDSIIKEPKPYQKAVESLRQSEEGISIALSFIKNDCVSSCINEQVYYVLLSQTMDTLNGVRLCLDTIKDYVEDDQSPTENPIALKVVE